MSPFYCTWNLINLKNEMILKGFNLPEEVRGKKKGGEKLLDFYILVFRV
jgi:hypothetical protein